MTSGVLRCGGMGVCLYYFLGLVMYVCVLFALFFVLLFEILITNAIMIQHTYVLISMVFVFKISVFVLINIAIIFEIKYKKLRIKLLQILRKFLWYYYEKFINVSIEKNVPLY